jgi:hypothetical protein
MPVLDGFSSYRYRVQPISRVRVPPAVSHSCPAATAPARRSWCRAPQLPAQEPSSMHVSSARRVGAAAAFVTAAGVLSVRAGPSSSGAAATVVRGSSASAEPGVLPTNPSDASLRHTGQNDHRHDLAERTVGHPALLHFGQSNCADVRRSRWPTSPWPPTSCPPPSVRTAGWSSSGLTRTVTHPGASSSGSVRPIPASPACRAISPPGQARGAEPGCGDLPARQAQEPQRDRHPGRRSDRPVVQGRHGGPLPHRRGVPAAVRRRPAQYRQGEPP